MGLVVGNDFIHRNIKRRDIKTTPAATTAIGTIEWEMNIQRKPQQQRTNNKKLKNEMKTYPRIREIH